MSTWLNALLSGACPVTVYRDGVLVPDLAAVGASLDIFEGTVTLMTPDFESHTWEVVASADFLLSPTAMRVSNASISGSPGVDLAQAQLYLRGSLWETVALSTSDPVLPNPAAFIGYGNGASLRVVES